LGKELSTLEQRHASALSLAGNRSGIFEMNPFPSNAPPQQKISSVYRVIRHGLISRGDKKLIFEHENIDVIRARQLELKREGCSTMTVAIVEEMPQLGPAPEGIPADFECSDRRIIY
jgi:hypothetical protein